MMRALALSIAALAIGAAARVPALAGGGGGCHMPSTDARGTTVAMQDACFAPTVIRVAPGTSVTWVNRDAMLHSVVRAGTQLVGQANGAGTSFKAQFSRPGVYPYYCAQHPGMIGAIVVGD
ncbi:MAG: cupredoxin domain-containing protein [bacterium]